MQHIVSRGVSIAFDVEGGDAPAVMFLPGFASDMRGAKAEFLAGWCAARGQGFLRFDYAGHGQSGGRFEDGSIGAWRDDAACVLDARPEEKMVLVGSSMGGWIALLLALARPERVAGLVLIAPAPDFTRDLMWAAFGPAERAALLATGRLELPSPYGAAMVVTRHLIEEGDAHLLLRGPVAVTAPVRILHGQRDPDVPWERSLTLMKVLAGEDARLILVKDGDHRLSRPADLRCLGETLGALLDGLRAGAERGAEAV